MPDDQREGLQEELVDIILHVLKRNPQLHYYQGYHDIVVTFLLVVGDRLATALVEKLSTHHLRYLVASAGGEELRLWGCLCRWDWPGGEGRARGLRLSVCPVGTQRGAAREQHGLAGSCALGRDN